MLERLIFKRIHSHTTSSRNFNTFQLGNRRYFSTEFALLLALDNIYHAIDTGSSTVLYHWTLVPPLTLLHISSSSIDYKTALVLPAELMHSSSLTSLTATSFLALVAPTPQRFNAQCSTGACTWFHAFIFIYLTHC